MSSHHVTLESIRVSEIGPRGNYDGIKLSGVQEFVVRGCEVAGWGGQAIDMVGCHQGTIERCLFRGREGFSQTTGVQAKGGSSGVAGVGYIRSNSSISPPLAPTFFARS